MYSEIWSWEKCKSKIRTLKGRLGFQETPVLRFLALSLSLEDGRIYDNLRQSFSPQIEPSAYCILSGYADARPMPESTRLVSFAQLRGGRSYQNAFIQRVIKPTENFLASKTSRLYHAAKLLGGERLGFGDYSVRIYSLPLVPITIILWVKTPEFPVSASILFSSSANYCLSTEQLAMLGELTSARLRYACEVPIARG